MEAQRIHVDEGVWGAERLRPRPRAKAEAKQMIIDCGEHAFNKILMRNVEPCAPAALYALSGRSERARKEELLFYHFNRFQST
jgi:hypothetical protein